MDGELVPVLEVLGLPTISLNQGAHRIEGRFHWYEIPETLAVGAHTALPTLTVMVSQKLLEGLAFIRPMVVEGCCAFIKSKIRIAAN